ncbi:MAG: hypothetical protein ACI86M_002836 [Saprospiraceae bacterium]|jgi:hypothetical protein
MLEEKESLNQDNLKKVISGYQELAQVYFGNKRLILAKQSLSKINKYQETLPYRTYRTKEIESQILSSEKNICQQYCF